MIDILSKLNRPEDIRKFVDEIFTPREKRDISLRCELVKRLFMGQPQRTIAAELKVSLCKITRGSKILKQENSIVKEWLLNNNNPTLKSKS